MNKKTIFFDVDGTLLSSRNGKRFCIPESTLEALRLLSKNGHRIAVCSGRPEAFIHRFFPGLFTSYVALNGSHVVYEGHTVLLRELPPEKVAALTAHFDSFGCRYSFVGKDHAWGRNISPHYPEKLNELYGIPDYMVMEWSPEDVHASMLDFLLRDESDYRRILPALDDTMILNYYPGSPASDLCFKEQDKGSGIRSFLQYAGIDKSDTIGFGDGHNDLPMMREVGFGVAMGNAVEEMKQAADYVTAPVFENGIFSALKYLKLI